LIKCRVQNLRLEFDATRGDCEAKFVDRQDFSAIKAVGRAVGRIQSVKIQLIAAQTEAAGAPFFELQLQRPIEIARPDVKAAQIILDPDRMIGDRAVDHVGGHAVKRQAVERGARTPRRAIPDRPRGSGGAAAQGPGAMATPKSSRTGAPEARRQ